jgi:hypothetical protein
MFGVGRKAAVPPIAVLVLLRPAARPFTIFEFTIGAKFFAP